MFHTQAITLSAIPMMFQRVYRRRGLTPPVAHSGHSRAALVPYRHRTIHRQYAQSHGYFWLPCVLCTRPYGGHEIGDTIPDPTKGPNRYISICPACTAERNGGRP